VQSPSARLHKPGHEGAAATKVKRAAATKVKRAAAYGLRFP
jgi:hypothetical protein